MSPKKIRVQLKLPRKAHEKIIMEQEEAARMKRQVKVLERFEARYKFEADERMRVAAKAQAVREAKLASRELGEQLRREEEERLRQLRKQVEDKKQATRDRLKKPAKEAASPLDKFRRGGAVAVAVTSKSFLGSFAAIESGQMGKSVLTDMKLHKKASGEERLQHEARRSKTAHDLQAFTNLEPTLRDKAATEKQLVAVRRRLSNSTKHYETLEAPHSPLLTRRSLVHHDDGFGTTSPGAQSGR